MDWLWPSSYKSLTRSRFSPGEETDEDGSDAEYEFVEPPRVAILKAEVIQEEDTGHFQITAEEAVDMLGVGAFCLFRAHPFHLLKLVLVCFQGFLLEYSILYYLVVLIRSRQDSAEPKERPDRSLYYIAVFLHIVNAMHSLPLAVSISLHFRELKVTWRGLIVQGAIFVVDSFVTPIAVVIIGSLYLCTSDSIEDIILNSCAVAFIGTIDDWILSMHHYVNKLGGLHLEEEYTLHLPHHEHVMSAMNWFLVIVPVVPAAATILLVHIGLDVLNL